MSQNIQVLKWNSEQDGQLNSSNMKRKLNKLGYNCTEYTFPAGISLNKSAYHMPFSVILIYMFRLHVLKATSVIDMNITKLMNTSTSTIKRYIKY